MKTIYLVGKMPKEIGSITPLMSQLTMQALAASMEKTVQSRLGPQEQEAVTVHIRLKKRFFGADEITGDFQGPPEILRKLRSDE